MLLYISSNKLLIYLLMIIIKLKQTARHTDVGTMFYCVGQKYE